MKLEVTNKEEATSVRVRQAGKPDAVLAPGEAQDFDVESTTDLCFEEVAGEGTIESSGEGDGEATAANEGEPEAGKAA